MLSTNTLITMFNKHFHTPKHHVLLSDSVRRPIGFRPPPNRIPSAVQSDSVRRPIRFRPPSDWTAFGARWHKLRFSPTIAALYANSRYTLTQPKTPCYPVDNVDNTGKRLIYNKKLLTYYVYNCVERQGIIRLNNRKTVDKHRKTWLIQDQNYCNQQKTTLHLLILLITYIKHWKPTGSYQHTC